MFKRLLSAKIKSKLYQGKVLIITGARQTGKTTLVQELLKEVATPQEIRFFNGDNPTDRSLLTNKDVEQLIPLVDAARLVFIDEGQKISTIGQTLKLLVDYYGQKKQIIVTGSSSLHLLNHTAESLTGRKLVFELYPLSWEELYPDHNQLRLTKELEQWLRFGQYPEIASIIDQTQKIELLRELTTSYLYRDVLELATVKHADALINLLKALALQIGGEVSCHELSRLVGIDKKTVERYITLLEQSYVIFRLAPYAGNIRTTISKLKKIYFYDLGIRNALINNFNPLNERTDTGALWENAVIVERRKWRAYHDLYANEYFWRTYGGAEVDLVEERAGTLFGYECKWNERKHERQAPKLWQEVNNSSYTLITPATIGGFVW